MPIMWNETVMTIFVSCYALRKVSFFLTTTVRYHYLQDDEDDDDFDDDEDDDSDSDERSRSLQRFGLRQRGAGRAGIVGGRRRKGTASGRGGRRRWGQGRRGQQGRGRQTGRPSAPQMGGGAQAMDPWQEIADIMLDVPPQPPSFSQ